MTKKSIEKISKISKIEETTLRTKFQHQHCKISIHSLTFMKMERFQEKKPLTNSSMVFLQKMRKDTKNITKQ